MKAQPKENSFKITRWYISPTLKQQFNEGEKFKTAQAIHCEPFVKHSTDKSEKLVLLRLEWGYILKNYIEYIADDEYYVEFSDFNQSEEILNKIIVTSYANFLQGYDVKNPPLDFQKLVNFDRQKVDALRQKILLLLQKRN